MKIDRDKRQFLGLIGGVSLLTLAATKGHAGLFGFGKNDDKDKFPYSLSEAEWKEKLTDEEFRVLREEGTEPARSSELNDEKRDGTYTCAGCDQKLYSSAHKFESGTGWPSFYQPIDGVESQYVGTSTDYKLIYPRTEVHCANCGGHLGHVFKDGPEPTGLRYCMNGVAMDFVPA